MGFPGVLLMGGAPMVGKSAVARILACRLHYGCISTDDIGAAIASVTRPDTHPAFHYMGDRDFREYYVTSTKHKLIQDINGQHAALWPALRTLIQSHATWGMPAVIEGWALRPEYVGELSGDLSAVYLLADDELIESRIRSSEFASGASDPATMLARYLERSLWYNAHLRDEVTRLGLSALVVSQRMRIDDVVRGCMSILSAERRR